MKRHYVMVLVTFFLMAGIHHVQAQGFLKKAKEKLQQKGNEAIDGLFEKKDDSGSNTGNQSGGGQGVPDNSGNTRNASGRTVERKMTPPDVNRNIGDAKSAMDGSNYSDARYAIHQAILGIEIELGEKILESMPSSIGDMSSDEENDEIYATGIGFVGLNIAREFSNDESWGKASVVNSSVMLSGYNVMINNAAYSTGSDDHKIIRIGDYRAVMEYQSNGYTIAIPFGQSSLFMLELEEFFSESEAESLAKEFDIDLFKQILGEQ